MACAASVRSASCSWRSSSNFVSVDARLSCFALGRLARPPFLERRVADRAGARQLTGVDLGFRSWATGTPGYAVNRTRGRGGTGRRAGFRSRWASALGGSTPLARTARLRRPVLRWPDDHRALRRAGRVVRVVRRGRAARSRRGRRPSASSAPRSGRCLDLGCGTRPSDPAARRGRLARDGRRRLPRPAARRRCSTPPSSRSTLGRAPTRRRPSPTTRSTPAVSIAQPSTDFDRSRSPSCSDAARPRRADARSSTSASIRASGAGRRASATASLLCAPGYRARRLARPSRANFTETPRHPVACGINHATRSRAFPNVLLASGSRAATSPRSRAELDPRSSFLAVRENAGHRCVARAGRSAGRPAAGGPCRRLARRRAEVDQRDDLLVGVEAERAPHRRRPRSSAGVRQYEASPRAVAPSRTA